MRTPFIRPLLRHTVTLGLLAVLTTAVGAQDAADPIAVARSVIQADRQAAVAGVLQLSPKEAEAFWPVYHQYRADLNQVADGLVRLVKEYAQSYPDVPADRATRLLKEWLALEKDLVSKRAKWLKKTGRILPPDKNLRFAQTESRLDLAVRLELAAGIPLNPIEGRITGVGTQGVAYVEGTPGGVVVQTIEISGRVTAVDPVGRKVTLLSPAGIKETVQVGPEAINFDQIRVGDRLEVVAAEQLVVGVVAAGAPTAQGAVGGVALAPKGAKPGGVIAGTAQVTARVTALDVAKRTATLRFDDGSTRTFPVRSDVDLSKHRVGDQVVFQVTEMVAVRVRKS